MKVPVRFTRGYPPYNTNEVAGFPADEARELVLVKQVATYLDAPSASGEDDDPTAADGAEDQPETGAEGEETPPPADDQNEAGTPLPEDIPWRGLLTGGGITTIEAVPDAEADLVKIDGIGAGRARQVIQYLKALEG